MPILRPCLVLMLLLALLTGVLYPLGVTLVARLAFPDAAAGSLLREHGALVGSRLIGQPADGAGWFWPRPSAVAWNAANSGGGNLAPVVAPQAKAWADQAAALRAAGMTGTLPADLVTASGSGLDPHLSPAALRAQVARVAAARGLPAARLEALIAGLTEPPQLGLLGAERVNVLELNLALARLAAGDR